MEKTRFLVVGAGVTGLSFAAFVDDKDYLLCEATDEIGGYCRTVRKEGFIWDYSGHFFHFRNPEIEKFLVDRMVGQNVRTVIKDSRIYYGDTVVDFPFQKNFHQLPKAEFIECLVDLFERDAAAPENFKQMLYSKFGRAIAEKFLIPYNEKLYATDLAALDVDAMGRFFPHANLQEILHGFRHPDNASYNATFTYPEGGAIQYVNALASEVRGDRVLLNERVERIDLKRKLATTNRREIEFEALISSAPFPSLLRLTGLPHDPGSYSWNKVLVFNLGFDRKGPRGVHWMYFPQRELRFYRVGFYDNIFDTERMSLYVEIGYPADAPLDEAAIAEQRTRVLADLRRTGIVGEHRLVADHHVVLDPAYVHITQRSLRDVAATRAVLATRNVYSLGRYGAWTYCSIEDNILEARELAQAFNAAG